jgi:superfamily II DNA helicase RecQ
MVLVVSPLLALMEDQATHLQEMGISATFMGTNQMDKTIPKQVLEGKWQVLLVSPELALGQFRKLFMAIRNKLVAVVIDEAHCVASW